MIEEFKSLCASITSFNSEEWIAMEESLNTKKLLKNQHFLREGEVCNKLGFVTKGYTRLYFLVEGEEITKDFSFENSFTGSVASFLSRKPAQFNVVAMEDTTILTLEYEALMKLYAEHHCWCTLGRKLAEEFAVRKENREVAFLLHSPEKRYLDLMEKHPYILQRVPLKIIASFLGMTPETLSRIRKKIAG